MTLCNVVHVLAQEHIDQVVNELEKEGVDVTKVVKRNDKKQIYSQVKSLMFVSKDGKFARQLEEAFEKDAENASSESRSKNNGNISYSLVFESEKAKSTYSLYINQQAEGDPRVYVTITFKDNSVERSRNIFDFDGGDIFSIKNGSGIYFQGDSLKFFDTDKLKELDKIIKEKLSKSKKLSDEAFNIVNNH